MMNRTHALTGATAWLALCAVQTGVEQLAPSPWTYLSFAPAWQSVLFGTAACAGAAILPDIDHPDSIPTNIAGPITRLLHRLTVRTSAWAFRRTATCYDWSGRAGRPAVHRGLTHTWPWATGLGLAAAIGSALLPAFGAVLLWLLTCCALRVMIPRRNANRAGIGALAVVWAAAAWYTIPGSWWWMGGALAVGALMHDLGDMITRQGCPLVWPFVWRGKRWWTVALPVRWRMHTGQLGERRLAAVSQVVAGFSGAALLALAVLANTA